MLAKLFKEKLNRKILSITSLIIISIIIFLIIVLPISLRPTPSLLNIGDVAFQDIHAPRSFSYISEYLTGLEQDQIEKTVAPVYLPADPAINRTQIETLSTILKYISSIRADEFSEKDQMLNDLYAIDLIEISDPNANLILEVTDEKWDSIKAESLYLLEKVMGNTIRDDQVLTVQRDLPPQIGFEFNEQESLLISEFVSQFISANSLYSNEKSAEAIASARESIEPVWNSYAAGETIVNNGDVIDAPTREALRELGYTEPKNRFLDYLSASLLIIVLVGLNFLYFRRLRQNSGRSFLGLPLITVLFLLFLLAARLLIPNHAILPYIFPIAAFGLTVSSVFDFETGIIGAVSLSILASYNQYNSIDLALYYFVPTAIAIFVLGRGRRVTIFFAAGLALALSGTALVISYRLTNSFLDFTGATTLIGAAFINGIGSVSFTLIFQYAISQILGKTTALQLMDLSRPDHPLLQQLLTKAPGTYQHSLQVANLAEQAVKEVNGDALLTRVGVLYHDIGKSQNPSFFIENQLPSQMDTHEDMDPVIASATIVQHVKDGINLAKEHRLPPEIKAFILEHHGTTLTRYQFRQAAEESGGEEFVEKSLFQYPGPIPQSKETALLMLADGTEARIRAENPSTIEEIRSIVKDSINYYLRIGQLNKADLTLRDIQKVIDSFSRTLSNTFHHRIKYPDQPSKESV
jgi:cyclic-di-AMP phosphodiesterase PgpH